MSRAAPARRLLAALVDEEALETAPIAEVRADLAALGLDPAHAIALSRRLAADTRSPAAALLRRIADAEADDGDLAQLEDADIASIRERLPAGAAAATIASAQRAAGRSSNVVGLRRRRSRRLLYGLSGVAAALAASLVLYVGLSTQSLQYAAEEQLGATKRLAPVEAEADAVADYRAAPEPPTREAARVGADQAATSAQSESEPSGQRQEALQKLSDDRQQALNQPAASEPLAPGAVAEEAAGALTSELRMARLDTDLRRLLVEHRITAFLVVAPDLVPEDLKREAYPAGDLLSRLDDARRAAAGRPIAALATLRDADRSYDAAIVAHALPVGEAAARQDVQAAAPAVLYTVVKLPDR